MIPITENNEILKLDNLKINWVLFLSCLLKNVIIFCKVKDKTEES